MRLHQPVAHLATRNTRVSSEMLLHLAPSLLILIILSPYCTAAAAVSLLPSSPTISLCNYSTITESEIDELMAIPLSQKDCDKGLGTPVPMMVVFNSLKKCSLSFQFVLIR